MFDLVLATRNAHKVSEIRTILAEGFRCHSLNNFPGAPRTIEDCGTFGGNATKKAVELAHWISASCPSPLAARPSPFHVLADDSGLEVDALHGAPGVHSARYAAEEPHKAGANTDDHANNARVLRELEGLPEQKRTARFVCVIAAAHDGRTSATFRGVVEGQILDHLRGNGGFGYDPMFYFPRIQKTFAELSPEEKAAYSHRGAAFRSFLEWFDKLNREP